VELKKVAGVDRAHGASYQKLITKVKRITPDYRLSVGAAWGGGADGNGMALFFGEKVP